jgi:hypothetical protein
MIPNEKNTKGASTGDGSPLCAMFVCVGSPIAGVLLAYIILVRVFLPTMGVGVVQLQRIIDLSQQLDRGLGSDPAAVIIGNSVVVEGVSASAVRQSAPDGWSVWNFAINGCDVTEQQMILPRLIESGPELVVLVFRPIDVGTVEDVDPNKLHAYSLAQYPKAFPPEYDPDRLPGLSAESWRILSSTDQESLLFFRRSPITFLQEVGFNAIRQGNMQFTTGGWDEPADLAASISGARLERHFRVVIENGLERVPAGESAGAEHITRAVEALTSAGIQTVLVVAPIHPDVPERHKESLGQLRLMFERLTAQYGCITGDASDLLDADDFADAIHPNSQGRQKFSAYIGGLFPEPNSHGPFVNEG